MKLSKQLDIMHHQRIGIAKDVTCQKLEVRKKDMAMTSPMQGVRYLPIEKHVTGHGVGLGTQDSIFYGQTNLIVHNCAASYAMMMHSSSF